MRNICFAAALLFCLQVYGAKAESMDSKTTYLNYKVATSNGQGSRRCPANLAFLPSTWMGDGGAGRLAMLASITKNLDMRNAGYPCNYLLFN